jgi:hypothetical protein
MTQSIILPIELSSACQSLAFRVTVVSSRHTTSDLASVTESETENAIENVTADGGIEMPKIVATSPLAPQLLLLGQLEVLLSTKLPRW